MFWKTSAMKTLNRNIKQEKIFSTENMLKVNT